jgi:hypothetical protein
VAEIFGQAGFDSLPMPGNRVFERIVVGCHSA